MWRLVQAGDCRILCQGRIHHFARGVDISFDKGNVRPERIQGGIVELPRYRDITATWWVLQKWFPPHIWGTREMWKEARAEEGERLFVQEFPSGGDYFMLGGPWSSLEYVGDLRGPIRQYLRFQLENPRDLDAYIRAEMAEEAAERARNTEKLESEIGLAEATLALTWKSASGDAQRVREQMAAKAGIVGHFGASEAWG